MQAQKTLRASHCLWVEERHRPRSLGTAASSPGTEPHWAFHSGMANSLIQDQDVGAERQTPASLLRFRNTNPNAVFSREHPRQANVASLTSTFTACSQADNYSAASITKTAKPAVLSYWNVL